MAAVERDPLPESVVIGMRYFNEVLIPQARLRQFEGRHIAVLETVLDEDVDPLQLHLRVSERFPHTVLYMPHAVELSPRIPVSDQLGVPNHVAEAKAYYLQVLRANPDWEKSHLGDHVAILGRQVVDRGNNLDEVLLETRAVYGNGPMFITQVTETRTEGIAHPPGKFVRLSETP